MNFQPIKSTVMKKYILSILTSAAAMAMFTSCDKDSEGLTGIVYYPAVSLEGASLLNWEMGVPFVDPGYAASYKGEDYTQNVTVTTDLNESDPQPGMYTISYSAVSPDGYSAAATRSVWVVDPADEINGYYSVDPDSYRQTTTATLAYGDINGNIRVVGWGDGKYEINDLLAGWYWLRAGYGTNYACWAMFTVDSDDTITLDSSYVPGWEDSASDLTGGTWDAATSTLSYCVTYAGMDFYVKMTKVE